MEVFSVRRDGAALVTRRAPLLIAVAAWRHAHLP